MSAEVSEGDTEWSMAESGRHSGGRVGQGTTGDTSAEFHRAATKGRHVARCKRDSRNDRWPDVQPCSVRRHCDVTVTRLGLG